MSERRTPKTLKDLQSEGLYVPGLNLGAKATIPTFPAPIQCPYCGERYPVYVQVQEMAFAVRYPKARTGSTRMIPSD